MFVLTILEKIKETRLKLSQGHVTLLQKIANYEEARVKLTNTQLNKLKYVALKKLRKTFKIKNSNNKTEKWNKKREEWGFLSALSASLAASVAQLVISSVVNILQEEEPPWWQEKDIMITWIKSFSPTSSFKPKRGY